MILPPNLRSYRSDVLLHLSLLLRNPEEGQSKGGLDSARMYVFRSNLSLTDATRSPRGSESERL